MQRRDLVLGGTAMFGAGLFSPLYAQPTVVRFGQSASLTGGQSRYGEDVRDGILAAFNAANKADSKGLRFELVTLDDGGNTERCKANVKKLIDSGVTALVGLTSGAAAEAALPMIEEHKVVLLGTASGNMGIRAEKLTMPYHVRAGYDDEYRRMVSYVKEFNMQRVGYVRLKDTSPANEAAMTAALKAVGIELTTTVGLSRNQPSFTAEVDQLMAAKLHCVLFTTNSHPVSRIVAGMSEKKYNGFYFSSSFAGQALLDDMIGQRRTIIMSQVVPRPTAIANAVVQRCRTDLAVLKGGAELGFTTLEAYIAGRVAIEATRTAAKTGAITRAHFAESLSELNVDLGGYPVRFSPGNRQGSHFVDVVALDRNGRIIG